MQRAFFGKHNPLHYAINGVYLMFFVSALVATDF